MGLADKLFREIEEKSDGFFSLESVDGRAMLTVNPAGSKGKPVQLSDVQARLKLLQIEPCDTARLKQIVETADGQPHDVGRWAAAQKENARAEIDISADAMKAAIYLHPPLHGGEPLSYDDLLDKVAKAGICHGVFEDKLRALAEKPEYHQWIPIAEGTPPVAGKNGYLKRFKSNTKPEPQERADGSVDHRELGVIASVRKNEVIAEIIPPVAGQDGQNIHGKILPATGGSPAQFQPGPNVLLCEDGTKLLSAIDGLPVFESGGTIRVDEILYLKDVDYSTGNIDFPGSIIVEEHVADGFTLQTKGSIILKQSVGKVYLKAGGDVTLAGGFMGRGEGRIEAEGDIHARFIEQGKLVAGRSIYIAEVAMHSFLIAKVNIILRGRRAEIIGGEAVAGHSIICNKAGAVVETRTRLTVGTPPDILTALEAMQNEIQQKRETLQKIENTIKGLDDREQRGQLSEQDKETRARLKSLREKFKEQLELTSKQLEAAMGAFEPEKNAYALIEKETFPGVEICFGRSRTWRTGIRPIIGRISVYLGSENEIVVGNNPPKQAR